MRKWLVGLVVYLAAGCGAFAASYAPPYNPSTSLNGADASAANVTAAGTDTARTQAAMAADRINVMNLGAFHDTQSNFLPVTATSGSASIFVSGGNFSSVDVGKRMIVDAAGPFRTLGYLASIPVTSPGSYTTVPTISLTGASSAKRAVAVAWMAAQSATVVSGGTGCPVSQSITLTLSGGNLGTAATVTGTTNGSGVLTGALTVTPGSYHTGVLTNTLLASTAVATTGVTCTTMPTVLPVWGVGTAAVVGQGADVPLTGVGATITGSASLGTPVVARVATPLSGQILSVQDTQHVTLDTTASQTISASTAGLTWGHDDAPAFVKAKTESDRRFAAGGNSVIYAPAGNYLLSSNIPTFVSNPSGLVGDGVGRTVLKMDVGVSTLLSWSECWFLSSLGNQLGTYNLSQNYIGPYAADFTIVGDETAPNEQDAIVLYDRNDRVLFSHITLLTSWGSFVLVGQLLNQTQSFMRESHWEDLYAADAGSPYNPTFDISTINGADGTNTNDFVGLMAWGNAGVGLAIRGQQTAVQHPSTQNKFHGVRLEGSIARSFSSDLLQIGDATYTGVASYIDFNGLWIVNSPEGANAVSFLAPVLASAPNNVSLSNFSIPTGRGNGINVQAGKFLRFDITGIAVNGTAVTVGPSTLVTNPVYFSAGGQEGSYTYNIDPTSAASFLTPSYRSGNPVSPGGTSGGGFAATNHNGSIVGGNALGAGAVDLQTIRTGPTQNAVAAYATIGGGRLNTVGVSGIGSTIAGGDSNTTQGTVSTIAGGSNGFDFGDSGHFSYSSTSFGLQGTAQFGMTVPAATIASGSTGATLTTNLGAVSGTNCHNLSLDNMALGGMRAAVHISDRTTPGNDYDWVVPNGFITRDTGASSVAIVLGTPIVTQRGSAPWLSSVAVTMPPNTMNGCVPISITVSNTNTHTLQAVGSVMGIETR
jgi:hypothetical protein